MNSINLVRKPLLTLKISQLQILCHFSNKLDLGRPIEGAHNIPPKEEVPKPEPVYKNPVTWLPFKWHRLPRFNVPRQSGDTITANECDPSLPKPDFEFSEELKSADEQTKQFFSLQTASKHDMKEVCRRQLLEKVRRHPCDTDSLEVKIAEMTIRVRALFEHAASAHRREVQISRVSFPIIIQKRNKLLKELRKIDNQRYLWLLDQLRMWYIPPVLGYTGAKYTKKWDIRRLTREHCERIINSKKEAYHQELKAQQEAFLKEKAEALKWIEEEERALGVRNKL